MNILPIKFLTSYDKNIFGEDLVNLSLLHRMGVPVASGIVVSPPSELVKKVRSHEKFGSIKNLKEQFTNSEEAKKLFLSFKEKKLTEKIWNDLLDRWFERLEIEIERKGSLDINKLPLKAEAIFFTKKIKSEGVAYISQLRKLVEVKTERGELDPQRFSELDSLIEEANKKLLLSYLYDWILDDEGFKLIRLRPFTQDYVRNDPTLPTLSGARKFLEMGSGKNTKTALKMYGNEEIDLGEWREISTPEEVISLEKTNADKFVINLDKIIGHLSGKSDISGIDTQVIKSVFEEPLRVVISRGSLVLVGGKSVLQDDILKFLVKLGIYGVIIDGDKSGLEEHIRTLEHMHINKLLD
ncbi:MAG: hypothetical protein ACD_30C00018G0002 [uncultured bacterium]|uniref:Uncharacterized protein n=4 Tax=Candidatus Daviesiibacteriota TaxID=1752718 RepID=A0A0G0HWW8_9BACT|nr:MAG: hypothetical protein ACD_30C00018G0002 [uncultured bacterium]KKQ08396.1 MAG: hypothetical protein US19_C0025G0010 [Candidatus Daviesbacteria bacterium GW2011_GWB1_36_5]KKQ15575.1 MAG: hypothetical protein US28_C0014G0018 [Candidatus Daviesbacteria bacterium GW2011_GWA1_36_8]OGE17533.1 MAG: hypothetical protein A2858_01370 [Candidatus Daviesbacteria bacterium RIFCSPHIGHO2_01_FULL_36_37]OGE36627.1 MAG: hypothetical protein A3E66_03215 [Candidatus Daviesbacteria bacterium RIFCSPHIGHO2_12_F